jgi:hypothetical protein
MPKEIAGLSAVPNSLPRNESVKITLIYEAAIMAEKITLSFEIAVTGST